MTKFEKLIETVTAEVLAKLITEAGCEMCSFQNEPDCAKVNCRKGIAKWLESPAEIGLSEREKEVLKALQVLGFTLLSRDCDERLFAFSGRGEEHWVKDSRNLFDFISYSNGKPTAIKDLLQKD